MNRKTVDTHFIQDEDGHFPGPWRVNVVLSNTPQFAKVKINVIQICSTFIEPVDKLGKYTNTEKMIFLILEKLTSTDSTTRKFVKKWIYLKRVKS